MAKSITATIPSSSVAKISKKFDRISRKALKFGVKIPTISFGEPHKIEVPIIIDGLSTGKNATITVVEVTVNMPERIVSLGGWEVLAAIDITAEGNVVRTLTETELPEWFATVPGTRCDHCHTQRQRQYLVAVRNPAGEIKIIGRSCSADYIGLDVNHLLGWHAALADAFDIDTTSVDFDDIASGRCDLSTLQLVQAAAVSIARYGYRRTLDAGRSTRDHAIRLLAGRLDEDDYKPLPRKPVDAGDVLAWAQGLAGHNDFERNMRIVASQPTVSHRHVGIACWLAEAYQRHLTELANKPEPKPEPEPEQVPVVEGRYEIVGTIISLKCVETAYGESWKMLVEAESDKGGVFRVFGTYPKALDDADADRGDKVRFTAQVTRSGKDESFGFFKRPTGAVVAA